MWVSKAQSKAQDLLGGSHVDIPGATDRQKHTFSSFHLSQSMHKPTSRYPSASGREYC